MYYIGIDLGASAVKLMLVDENSSKNLRDAGKRT